MISHQEAQQLMSEFVRLRKKAKSNPKYKFELQKIENLCMEKFRYLVTMRTNRYKNFSNHEDLIQEGYEALLKAMNSYNPNKGNLFWWIHKYIDTRISRSAN